MPECQVVDLFCGAGGLSLGLKNAGLSIVAGADFEGDCRHAYSANTGANFHRLDILDTPPKKVANWYSPGAVKVLVGGPPCQAFSLLNMNTRGDEGRFDLIHAFMGIISEVSPDIIAMENVIYLKNTEGFRQFVSYLRRSGYSVSHIIAKSSDYGVPQLRRRLILLASKFGKISLEKPWENSYPLVTLRDAIGHLPHIVHGETCHYDSLHTAASLSNIDIARVKASRPGGTWMELPKEILPKSYVKLLASDRGDKGTHFNSSYGRLEWDKLCFTITSKFRSIGSGRYTHPEQDRALSLREGALVQTFPEDFEFYEMPEDITPGSVARMIGNAVPVKLGEAIGRSILRHLRLVY